MGYYVNFTRQAIPQQSPSRCDVPSAHLIRRDCRHGRLFDTRNHPRKS